MNMKYYRFLYETTEGCFVHLGEIRDTKTVGNVTFMFLSTADLLGDWRMCEQTGFLFPENLDLLVIGDWNETVQGFLKKVLCNTEIKKIVTNANTEFAKWYQNVDCGGNNEIETEIISLNQEDLQWDMEQAGWRVSAKAWQENLVALKHEPLMPMTAGEVFSDCVMNVKIMNSEKVCRQKHMLDDYGCAMGCTLYQEHDVCNDCSKAADRVYKLGTLIYPEAWKMENMEEAENTTPIRFFVLGKSLGKGETDTAFGTENREDYKKYFIAPDQMVSDQTIANICRSGQYHCPVILKEGQGICSAGFLKYKE